VSILDFFADEMKTVIYTPVSTWATDPTTGGSVETEGTTVELTGLLWTRSEAAQYFGQQIKSNVSSYFAPVDSSEFFNDDGTPDTTGSITYSGITHDIETVQNVGEQGEVMLVGLKVHE
jgi:hypothetical protein